MVQQSYISENDRHYEDWRYSQGTVLRDLLAGQHDYVIQPIDLAGNVGVPAFITVNYQPPTVSATAMEETVPVGLDLFRDWSSLL
ncbi:MAG: hypothetical protein QM520_03115 [Gammaproteobacteria bacterium]|nr:hypothetical protein [Gammaproteobacteria bacterium]